jgi:hypothetical protein
MNWLIKRLSYNKQKKLALAILERLLLSKNSGVDNKLAEQLLSIIVKSQGNKISGYTVRD